MRDLKNRVSIVRPIVCHAPPTYTAHRQGCVTKYGFSDLGV
ncbi:hypothetical protein CKA32_002635 [Geitlerinema sp. FC II]|nr:hypothetical protein CKA32_002635 [Geitlerinema sp. FC II]